MSGRVKRDRRKRRTSDFVDDPDEIHHKLAEDAQPSSSSSTAFSKLRLLTILSAGLTLTSFISLHVHLQNSLEHFDSDPTRHHKEQRDNGPIAPREDHLQHQSQAVQVNSTKDNFAAADGLSACLLVNDENPRLPEWIAYHYHVLPLRSLIVAVDPNSRVEPNEILNRWQKLMGLDVQIWGGPSSLELRYMPRGRGGACNSSDPDANCLMHHRSRQHYFVKACLENFRRRGKTWVLLTDVDEYIMFNTIHGSDPPTPFDAAPDSGVPTLSNWTWSISGSRNITGTVSGLSREGWQGKKNGDLITTLPMVDPEDEIFANGAGSVLTDKAGNKWFLRDDFTFRDAIDITLAEAQQRNLSVLRDSFIESNMLHGTIYNDKEQGDGTLVYLPTSWKEPKLQVKTIYGGHVMKSLNGQSYYVQRDTYLLPHHLSSLESLEIRTRLPKIDSGKTIYEVLSSEMEALYANETIGPCLALPRLLFGSLEDRNHSEWKSMAPNGFNDDDFATVRFRWHALPDIGFGRILQKNIVDVSRIPRKSTNGGADGLVDYIFKNIHTPVTHFCREKAATQRYSASFLRVNHYLDSFEAYSYRNDARPEKKCRKCYDDKAREASVQPDDDIRPWLKGFVDSVGREKAEILLAGAGKFT